MVDGGAICQPETMASFFDTRAEGYEDHMQVSIESFDAFYQSVAGALPDASLAPSILDLGIGTGLEAERVFARFPRAEITGIDVSTGMLSYLRRKPAFVGKRLALITGSFLELDLGTACYDAAISVMALHHWGPPVKRDVYRRVRRALKVGGVFVNGDYVASDSQATQPADQGSQCMANNAHLFHVDFPLCPETEVSLLREAGFSSVSIVFRQTSACVFRARC